MKRPDFGFLSTPLQACWLLSFDCRKGISDYQFQPRNTMRYWLEALSKTAAQCLVALQLKA
jgi:hypothetical protein